MVRPFTATNLLEPVQTRQHRAGGEVLLEIRDGPTRDDGEETDPAGQLAHDLLGAVDQRGVLGPVHDRRQRSIEIGEDRSPIEAATDTRERVIDGGQGRQAGCARSRPSNNTRLASAGGSLIGTGSGIGAMFAGSSPISAAIASASDS